MKRFLLTSAAAILAVQSGQASAGSAAGKPRPQIAYFLPKTLISAEVSQTLTSCPESEGDMPGIETVWSIVPHPVPDPTMMVKVDTSSGFFARRSTALILRPDGTLDSFNAASTGEAGPVIVSALKLAATVMPGLSPAVVANSASPPPPPPPWACKPDVAKLVANLNSLGAQIAAIDDKVLQGTATTAETQLAERLRKRRAATRQTLTLTSSLEEDIDPVATNTLQRIAMTEQAEWFNAGFDTTRLVGAFGYAVEVKPQHSSMIDKEKSGDGSVGGIGELAVAKPRLVYRRPVSATIEAGPCTAPAGDCIFSKAADHASARDEAVAPIAQWSGLYSLSVGRGGLFGHREAKAKFDPFGAPLELSYGTASGAADIASTIDAGTATIGTARDAELASLERAIKLEEARQKLRELKTPK